MPSKIFSLVESLSHQRIKMKLALVGFAILAMAHAGSYQILDMDKLIKDVNNAHTTWTAGNNFAPDTPLSYFKGLMGAKLGANGNLRMMSYSGIDLPEEFDARKQWPQCPTISHLLDQGNCGSCWAVAGASAFSDRVCIASNGTFTTPLSAEELLSCCDECGDGCDGGYPSAAWDYFVSNGIATGGDYNSGVGCQPYLMEPCEHHIKGSRPQCSSLPTAATPECQSECINSKYTKSFERDHHKASTSYGFDSVEAAQEDILKYGSIEAGFTVYADFVAYKSGVYQHVTGSALGGHAVRIIGWGTENDTPYWLVANSWNSDWGDKGTFKILRGSDECGFEDGLVAGRI